MGELWLGGNADFDIGAELEALPVYDYAAEGRRLYERERYEEALVVIDAGLEDEASGEAVRTNLRELKDEVERAKNSWRRWLYNVGRGVVTGRADTPEGLAGATVVDFCVIGDIRDLIVQGWNWYDGDDVDELIVALSAIGVVTTSTPLDWVPSLLKAARRAGTLTPAFVKSFTFICRMALRTRNIREITKFCESVVVLVRRSSLPLVTRMLRHVNDPADVARLAELLSRWPRRGLFALQVLDDDIVKRIIRSNNRAAARAIEELAMEVARRGRAGTSWWYRNAGRIIQPRAVLGVVKGGARGYINRRKLMGELTAIIGVDAVLASLLALLTFAAGDAASLYVSWIKLRWERKYRPGRIEAGGQGEGGLMS
jgi:hypothetical protein